MNAQREPVEVAQGDGELFGHVEDHALARRFRGGVEALLRVALV